MSRITRHGHSGCVFVLAIIILALATASVRVQTPAAGATDFSFAVDGVAQDLMFGSRGAAHLLVQPDGRIVVAGPTYQEHIGVLRLTPFGVEDVTFAAPASAEGELIVDDVARFSNGDLALVGRTVDGGGGVTISSTGDRICTFTRGMSAGAGVTAFDFYVEASPVGAEVVTHAGNERLLLASTATWGVGGQVFTGGGLALIDRCGNRDETFATSGLALHSMFSEVDGMHAQADGNILLWGRNINTIPDNQLMVVRVNSDGTLDTTFANAGVLVLDPLPFRIADVVATAGGSILIGLNNGAGDVTVARFDASGQADPSWDGDGFMAFALTSPATIRSLAVDHQDNVLVAGMHHVAEQRSQYHDEGFVARIDANGTRDLSFANGVRITRGPITDVEVQPGDGKIVLAINGQQQDGVATEVMRLHGDDPGPATLNVSNAASVEGAGNSVTFTVSLSGGVTVPVTLDYYTEDGNAVAPDDYLPVTGSLTFTAPGSQQVVVELIDDGQVEVDETFLLRLDNVVGAALGNPYGTAMITDDDRPIARARIQDTTLIYEELIASDSLVTIEVVNGAYVIQENGGPLAVGPGCSIVSQSPVVASCALTAAIHVLSGSGNDRVTMLNTPSATIDGGSGNDSFFGADADETFLGGPGADMISCGGGTDRVTADAADVFDGCESATVDAVAGGSVAVEAEDMRTTVTTPVAGVVTIDTSGMTPPPSSEYDVIGQAVHISAPTGTAANPLVIAFRVDVALLQAAGVTEQTVAMLRNGVAVDECAMAGSAAADPDPCVARRELDAFNHAVITVLTSQASTWSLARRIAAPAPPSRECQRLMQRRALFERLNVSARVKRQLIARIDDALRSSACN